MSQLPPHLTMLRRRKHRWRPLVRRLLAAWDRWRRRPWTTPDPEPAVMSWHGTDYITGKEIDLVIVDDLAPTPATTPEPGHDRLLEWARTHFPSPTQEKPLD